ncbi:ferrodoxin reductase-like protein, putative [Plasmodium gallinaceum]|uniref:Ferrodoxin reductase-like protein, putative n=1 Tax=Plasmodium gallinaceum TaxID=5849 RepID=A0A1J1GLB8_PLAGA|nr:ferrodoxin reductase-like protein, putative [Plasmodium gallinaceum]CRG93132.1 ferrodoxin reductase-like protein, putative [Plasmodium gallinaceum]
MRRNILCINEKICNLLKSRKLKNDISYNLKNNFSSYSNKNTNIKTYILWKNKNEKEFLNNYNFLLFMSLMCATAFLNKKFKGMRNNLVTCTNLEKVFLIKKDEIKDGEMKEVKVRNEKDCVLLVNVNNNYYCLGPKCPHYSAPLKTGVLTSQYITCPWHDAKFDIKTGECINGPSFDDIPKYEVVVEDDKIYAYLPEKLEIFKEKKICSCKDTCEKKSILIIGGGAATLGALETFLKLGYNGKLIICSKDSYKPYDRPTLSKNLSNYSKGSELYEEIKLKEDEYYNKENISYMNDVCVTKVDEENKKAFLSNGKVINYDKILITSGVGPCPSPIKDVESNNLLTLHNLNDNVKISGFAKEGTKCVIIGSSFIACELSSALKKKNVNVSVVSKDSVPFYGTFGEKIGRIVLDILKDKNIKFYSQMYPTEYIIDKGFMKIKNGKSIHGVRLNNGEVISCDYVIEALGCKPNSEFLDEKFKDNNNFIVVDKHFKVKNSNDMYAAGDVCVFPYFVTNDLVNICHWNVAIQQGRIAAHNMLSAEKKEFNFMPFFNTNIFGKNFRYCGYVKNYDKIIYEGDLNKYNFVGYFVKNDKVMSILTLGNNKMAALNECLTRNMIPKVYELEGGLKNSDSMIASLKM